MLCGKADLSLPVSYFWTAVVCLSLSAHARECTAAAKSCIKAVQAAKSCVIAAKSCVKAAKSCVIAVQAEPKGLG